MERVCSRAVNARVAMIVWMALGGALLLLCKRQPFHKRCILFPLAAILAVSALGSGRAAAQFIITEIIDSTGDPAGNILSTPIDIAVDAADKVYVTGFSSSNAFKITPAGVITQIIDATGDGAGNGLDDSYGIAVDAAGNAYVTGFLSNNAFKITPGGAITEIIDSSGDGAGNGLVQPRGIAVDAAGNAYVTGQNSNNAFKITPGGVITEIIDFTGDGVGNGLTLPLRIAVDAAGNAYVTGHFSDNAFKITPAGVITEIIDSSGDGAGNGLVRPRGIAVDAAGNAYVAGQSSNNAFKITPGGAITQIIDSTGDGAGNILSAPVGIAVDAAGNAYVAGQSNNAFKITPAGVITQIIDSAGDGVGNVLDGALHIAVDAAGNAYVTGHLSDNAFKIGAPTSVVLNLDIKPGSCPNSFNRNSRGVLPVAIVGSDEFDVTLVDLSTVELSRADGLGGSATPNEGPPGPHSTIDDVATGFAASTECECDALAGDGILDLSMKFRSDDVVAALELNALPAGDLVPLVVTGTLLDGTPFQTATDCIRLVPPGTPPGMLTVTSNVSAAWVAVSPLDTTLDGGGFAAFERVFPLGTVVTLTAEATMNGRPLVAWRIDGITIQATSPTRQIVITGFATTARAIYQSMTSNNMPILQRRGVNSGPSEPQ